MYLQERSSNTNNTSVVVSIKTGERIVNFVQGVTSSANREPQIVVSVLLGFVASVLIAVVAQKIPKIGRYIIG